VAAAARASAAQRGGLVPAQPFQQAQLLAPTHTSAPTQPSKQHAVGGVEPPVVHVLAMAHSIGGSEAGLGPLGQAAPSGCCGDAGRALAGATEPPPRAPPRPPSRGAQAGAGGAGLCGVRVAGAVCSSADDLYARIFGSDPPLAGPAPWRQQAHQHHHHPQQQQQQQQQDIEQRGHQQGPWQQGLDADGHGQQPSAEHAGHCGWADAADPTGSSGDGVLCPLPSLPPVRIGRSSGSDDAGGSFACDDSRTACSSSGGWPQPVGCSSPLPCHRGGSAATALRGGRRCTTGGGSHLKRVRPVHRSSAGLVGGSGSFSTGWAPSAGALSSLGPPASRSVSLPGGQPGVARNLFGAPLAPPPWPCAGCCAGRGVGLAALCGAPCGAGCPCGGGCGCGGGAGAADDALPLAAGDDGAIREINAGNVLSANWGPPAGAAKLLGFKYSAAMSPLGAHVAAAAGRSPFASPRHQRR
jgi:hypothetical protein